MKMKWFIFSHRKTCKVENRVFFGVFDCFKLRLNYHKKKFSITDHIDIFTMFTSILKYNFNAISNQKIFFHDKPENYDDFSIKPHKYKQENRYFCQISEFPQHLQTVSIFPN